LYYSEVALVHVNGLQLARTVLPWTDYNAMHDSPG
jgi:hypothetical protein